MKKGFTLIELLVVIAVIAVLSTLAVVSLNSARQKARDARRFSDIRQIRSALELYFSDYGRYPDSLPASGERFVSNVSGSTTTLLAKMPGDPLNRDSYVYGYTPVNDGASYELAFAIEKSVLDYEAGNYQATPSGFKSVTIVETYSWSYGSWSSCSASCDGGIQTRSASCLDSHGIVVSDSFCGIPVVQQDCNTQPCAPVFACGDMVQYDGGPWDSKGVYNQGGYYKTVATGGRCWLADNLNAGTQVASLATNPCVKLGGNWACQGDAGFQKYCYGNNGADCESVGGLYEWVEAMELPQSCVTPDNASHSQIICGGKTFSLSSPYQGICPAGWHIPTLSELAAANFSTLHFNSSGYRLASDGSFDSHGQLLISSEPMDKTYVQYVTAGGVVGNYSYADGASVRCVYDTPLK